MYDWIVSVKRKGNSSRKRIYVEGVDLKHDAEMLAISKVGGDDRTHEANAEAIDDKVSTVDPNYSLKDLYDELVAERDKLQAQLTESTDYATEMFNRSERTIRERDRYIRVIGLVLPKIAYLKTELEDIERMLNSREKHGV